MIWAILKEKAEYDSALNRVEELLSKSANFRIRRGKELMLLGYLIDRYEEENFLLQDQIESK